MARFFAKRPASFLVLAKDLQAVVKPLVLPTWVALPLTAKENAGFSLTDIVKREVGRFQTHWETMFVFGMAISAI